MKNLLHTFIVVFLLFVFPYSLDTTPKQLQAQGLNEFGLSNVGYAPFNLTASDFNCDGFLEATEQLDSLHVAFLYNTFGNDFSCLRRILSDERLQTLEIALINEPGHRNGRLGSYEFLYSIGSVADWNRLVKNKSPKIKKKFARYAYRLQKVLQNHLQPHTTLLINPGLESNLSDSAGRVLVSWTRELFPSARIVWNPLRSSNSRRRKAKADMIEAHGFYPNISAPCIYNMDGMDVSYDNRPAIGERHYAEGQVKNWVNSGRPLFQLLETYANSCEVAFLWTAESNGIDEKSSRFVDPRKRNHHISTDMYKLIFRDVNHIHRYGRVYPNSTVYSDADKYVEVSCDVVTSSFADGEKVGKLLKQSEFSDRGGVLILPREYSGAKRATLVQGKSVVDVYKNAGTYKDGRVLFRSEQSPTKYPFNTYLILRRHNKKICFKIANPRTRID